MEAEVDWRRVVTFDVLIANVVSIIALPLSMYTLLPGGTVEVMIVLGFVEFVELERAFPTVVVVIGTDVNPVDPPFFRFAKSTSAITTITSTRNMPMK